ncbi:hypothetical protein AVEN_33840-1 [Araneus ventricosus]|uniref:Uncharacterized protein n=1 Tax=Araneus ventricosus TaxID=182803 RepID=A0A4Y2J3U8_ARAVE|nr:hypothetical protein AVEN_33840-1 [Araneus ventricosus]
MDSENFWVRWNFSWSSFDSLFDRVPVLYGPQTSCQGTKLSDFSVMSPLLTTVQQQFHVMIRRFCCMISSAAGNRGIDGSQRAPAQGVVSLYVYASRLLITLTLSD